jgi:hypothetical protein
MSTIGVTLVYRIYKLAVINTSILNYAAIACAISSAISTCLFHSCDHYKQTIDNSIEILMVKFSSIG